VNGSVGISGGNGLERVRKSNTLKRTFATDFYAAKTERQRDPQFSPKRVMESASNLSHLFEDRITHLFNTHCGTRSDEFL
jgi:hypothetical protein